MTQAWYPFYWADYSSKTMHLTQGQHGAYILFLRYVYTTEKPIPNDSRYSIARALLEQEQKDADFILSNFFTLTGDSWHNMRAKVVIKETKDRHKKRVNAGSQGGKKKSSNAKSMLEQKSSNVLVTTTTTTFKKETKEKVFLEEAEKEKAKFKRLRILYNAGRYVSDEDQNAMQLWESNQQEAMQ